MKEAEPQGSYAFVWILVVGIVLFLIYVFVLGDPLYLVHRHPGGGTLTACRSNLKNISTALEMYSTDANGLYPLSLDALTPGYLRTIPTCPFAGSMTYVYTSHSNPDNFTVYCAGNNHDASGMGPNQPSYTSTAGLQP